MAVGACAESRAMMISPPLGAASIRLDRWVFAAWMVICCIMTSCVRRRMADPQACQANSEWKLRFGSLVPSQARCAAWIFCIGPNELSVTSISSI